MFLGNKLPRSTARHLNSQTDELVSRLSFILTVVSTGQKSSELLFTETEYRTPIRLMQG